MGKSGTAQALIRQDWIRNNISLGEIDQYIGLNHEANFITRKGIPRGNYILRFSIDSAKRSELVVVAIEPVGGGGSPITRLQVPLPDQQVCLTLPLRLSQRSRIRIHPCTEAGVFGATFSVLPTTKQGCIRLLRQWTQLVPDELTKKPDTQPSNDELNIRWEQLTQKKLLKHNHWGRGYKSRRPAKEKDPSYQEYLTSIEPAIKPTNDQIKSWLELNPDAPLISIAIPTYNTSPEHLRKCLDSILAQRYPNWELCVCDDNSPKEQVRTILKEYQAKKSRIKLHFRQENGHICKASNDALTLATGEFVCLVDHDDELHEDALYWLARTIRRHPQANLIYSDEDKINEEGIRSSPHFKPSFNIDLLLSYNFISHLGAYRRDVLTKIGGFRPGLEGSQDHDLALRTVLESSPDQIIHIPRVLYHWRVHTESTASDPTSKSYTSERGLKAVQHYLDQQTLRGGATAQASLEAPNRFRCHWTLPTQQPSVELIIPTRDRADVLELAVRSILDKTTYSNYVITIVDNQSVELETTTLFAELQNSYPNKIRIHPYNKPFNYSAINNDAARHSTADILGLVNNDVEVISPEWLSEMVSHCMRADVGCVGAKLIYSNNTIQHGGVIIGIGEVAGHAHKYFPRESLGYVDRLIYTQQLSAVTAACLLVRREIYNEVGGLNEQDLQIAFNDVDFCLRVHSKGYRNIYTPYSILYHHESISRGTEDTPEKQQRFLKEVNFMLNQYDVLKKGKLPSDLFYNPNLTGTHENFAINHNLESVIAGLKERERKGHQQAYYQKQHSVHSG